MADYNNSQSNIFQELKGSAKVSVAAYTSGTPSWVNIGPVRGIEVAEDMSSVDVEFDNTDKRKYVSLQEMTVSFEQMQPLNTTVMQLLRSGVDEFTTTAGVLVEDYEQTIASGDWEFNQFLVIDNQNYDGGIITINSVTGSVDSAIVAETDYFLGVDEYGRYGITIIDSATVTTETQDFVIDHDYTPSASFKREIGGAREFPYIMMKFETVTVKEDDTAGLHTIICYKGQQEEGNQWAFSQDAADDPLVANPISYRFFSDSNRTANSKDLIAEQTWTTS